MREYFIFFRKNLAKMELTNEDELVILNTRIFVYSYMLLPACLIGLLLNVFTIVVLMHRKMHSSTNVYLTALSVANIICLINFIFLYSVRYIVSNSIFRQSMLNATTNHEMHVYESYINLIYGSWSPVFTTFQLYAIYLTCAVSVDRFICLLYPFKVDKICSIKNTLTSIFLIFVFCFVYNLPKWFEVESYAVVTSNNRTIYQARQTNFAKSPLKLIISKYAYIVFVYGLPFATLTTVNFGIIVKLIEIRRRKRLLTAKPPKNTPTSDTASIAESGVKHSHKYIKDLDLKVTFMILAVVLAFFIFQSPYLIINIMSTSGNPNGKWFHIIKVWCDFFLALNCSINFLIYCFFGQNFRAIAVDYLRVLVCQKAAA